MAVPVCGGVSDTAFQKTQSAVRDVTAGLQHSSEVIPQALDVTRFTWKQETGCSS